ncbi:hypothetical protein M5J15_08385 [Serratia symbiotica]|uniref:MoaF-related domain-containing protein n=1 Tax=Serratia symbiotica TaxID=138074 RepID=UPI002090CB14|nr:hypothetical protein [Serratia symbiotica]USS96788.1 hypothetical protein M5J15_08385 [Serratia symbiotica]
MAAENVPENTIQADNSQFIALGKVVQVNVSDIEYKLDFPDNKTMTFTGIGADSQDDTDTVEYTAIKIRPQVYMVYWHEPKSGDNVVHIEDYLHGEVYANIASRYRKVVLRINMLPYFGKDEVKMQKLVGSVARYFPLTLERI